MRSRYSAFTRGDVAYLRATQLAPTRGLSWEETERWAKSVAWLSLKIVSTEAGGEGDDAGVVEFIASYLDREGVQALHERSSFVRAKGPGADGVGGQISKWTYDAGKPEVTTTKVERNAPCPCGSGRKFKACHA